MPSHTPPERAKRKNKGGATRGRARARSVASSKARIPTGTAGSKRKIPSKAKGSRATGTRKSAAGRARRKR